MKISKLCVECHIKILVWLGFCQLNQIWTSRLLSYRGILRGGPAKTFFPSVFKCRRPGETPWQWPPREDEEPATTAEGVSSPEPTTRATPRPATPERRRVPPPTATVSPPRARSVTVAPLLAAWAPGLSPHPTSTPGNTTAQPREMGVFSRRVRSGTETHSGRLAGRRRAAFSGNRLCVWRVPHPHVSQQRSG